MTKLHQLAELGQAIWLDYIQRSFITTGELQRLIDEGLRGMTSNPTIFEKAIAKSSDYDADLQRLIAAGQPEEEIFLGLAIDDIQQACDLFLPVFEATQGSDGFVSLEVNPVLANDTAATFAEAKRLWELVDRPNLMVKIPATKEGLPAITEATAAGINVNVTLIFSLERYADVIAAYIQGLAQRVAAGQPVDRINSVASFFVSRVDSKVDKRLEEIMHGEGPQAEMAANLRGKAAVANAKLAYEQFSAVFLAGETFAELQAHGARLQRPLWASTSTKNPDYSDILYVQELIAPHTVNTLPQDTLEKFIDHGEPLLTLKNDLDEAKIVMQSLEQLGISMEQVTQDLEEEGVASFAKSYESLLKSIGEKRQVMADQTGQGQQPVKQKVQTQPEAGGAESATPAAFQAADAPGIIDMHAGALEPSIGLALEAMQRDNLIKRLWEKDHTLWSPEPDEITNRLGWLNIAGAMRPELERIERLRREVNTDGYTHALLLGMGGSSLAPELFARTFSRPDGALDLAVLDSTDPEAVLAHASRLDPTRTLFIVSTKSGTTEETASFFKFFYNLLAEAAGPESAGRHFIAITDPGSKLAAQAEQLGFRQTFLNDPNIGGRYSALSFFGVVPAVLAGVDAHRLLDRAEAMAAACAPEVPVEQNPAARLGAILAEFAQTGRDKLTFVLPDSLASFGDWVEQLIAESTGKAGKGILPVVGEPLGVPAVYGEDRLLVHMPLAGEAPTIDEAALNNLVDSGVPLIRIPLQDRYDLGGQFFLWELATAIASARLGINPFDQPNVESAKRRAREMTSAYKASGSLPVATPLLSQDGIEVYGPERIEGVETEWNLVGGSPPEALVSFLAQARPGDYVALQAFVPPTPETEAALQDLRLRVRDRYHLATTTGFGPRFLHSTGQLHKGDAGNGLFIQFTSESRSTAPIPDEPGAAASGMDFGTLKQAQAMGDRQALLDAGRRVLRFHLIGDPAGKIRQLAEAIPEE